MKRRLFYFFLLISLNCFFIYSTSTSTSSSSSSSNFELLQVIYVSRHGIRSPYPPNYGTLDDFTSYSSLTFSSYNNWNMKKDDFYHQKLTTHGKLIIPYLGSYFYQRFLYDGLDLTNCKNIVCYSDDSSRDIETAKLWLQGFGCNNNNNIVKVNIVNKTHHSKLRPVVYDLDANLNCSIATETQVMGLIGGNVDSLINAYASSIELIMDVIEMPSDATICSLTNPDFNPVHECTLFETGYKWTGYVYDGGFKSPIYYARYFSEYFMLQYLSNVTNWAFGKLTPKQLLDINAIHVKIHELGTNYWNSLTYGSEQLAYIIATMNQMITKKVTEGCQQDIDTKLLLLFSHDANILYLQRLLNLNWIPEGYTQNVADPGGALIFELWKNKIDQSIYVKIHYDIATPEQQRYATKLSLSNPPSISTLIIPECGSIYCPWEFFKEFALSRIDINCIQEPLKSSVQSLLSSISESSSNKKNNPSTQEILMIIILSCFSLLLAIGVLLYSCGYRVIRTVKGSKFTEISNFERFDL